MLKKFVAICLSVQVIACLLVGCANSEDTTNSVESVPFEPLPTVEEVVSVSVEEEETNTVTVHTEYGDLYFQEQWSEYMKTEQAMDGDVLAVSFMAEFNGQRYSLFEIIIGSGEEDPAAWITDEAGVQRDVSVVFEEVLEHEELSQEEQNRLYAMQEDINFVIENLT